MVPPNLGTLEPIRKLKYNKESSKNTLKISNNNSSIPALRELRENPYPSIG